MTVEPLTNRDVYRLGLVPCELRRDGGEAMLSDAFHGAAEYTEGQSPATAIRTCSECIRSNSRRRTKFVKGVYFWPEIKAAHGAGKGCAGVEQRGMP